MMVNERLDFQAVFDWEFAYAAPAGFLCDPPSWLLGSVEPTMWTADEAARYHDDAVRAFIDGVEAAEADAARNRFGNELSRRMRASWESGRFWFHVMLREGFMVSQAMRHCGGREPFCSVPPPPPDEAEVEALAEKRMRELAEDGLPE
ncbi:hypothetical protein PWT90_11045 [Aphanocladium album]|nr:hypothetical protein PWT90_11045 [Aphanocladium album]